jgi:uncharacterized protein
LVVAALSARVLAEAAQQAGHRVVALDCFGDADTRRASLHWRPLSEGASLQIAPDRLLHALAEIAQLPDAMGWVAGAGFEHQPALLSQGAALLPLLGMGAAEVQKLRDPRLFFAALDELDISHPPVQFELPRDRAGWLVKDSGGCGAWHIRDAFNCEHLPARHCLQREVPGVSMSATLIANGHGACVLGINQQLVRRTAWHRFMFCGVLGPVPTSADVASRVQHIAQQLSAKFNLRGLCSLDFLLDGDSVQVLEINPRPPASLVLYPGALVAHLHACSNGALPKAWATNEVRGQRIVFAPKPLHINHVMHARLLTWPHCHDRPNNAMSFEAGDPVCSVQAQASTAAQVAALLNQRHDSLLTTLETDDEHH